MLKIADGRCIKANLYSDINSKNCNLKKLEDISCAEIERYESDMI